MTHWWRSLFPPPVDDAEAQVRAHAIGAFWGLVLLVPAVIGVVVWALAGLFL